MATERDKKAGGIQVATLLTLMGPKAMDVYRLFDWGSEAEKHDIAGEREVCPVYHTTDQCDVRAVQVSAEKSGTW